MILYFFTVSLLPQIIPLSFQTAKKTLNKWTYEAYANDDIEMAKMFKNSLKHYDFNPSSNFGCIGIKYENSLKSIVLMEKINNNICIWDVSCKDYSSGSLLVKALVKTSEPQILMMNTVSDRWKIARLYYLPIK